jgi:hypothetical protein
MPMFYATDDLQSWFTCALQESYDALENSAEQKEWVNRVLINNDTIAEECEDYIDMYYMKSEKKNLFYIAIMNSVCFEKLLKSMLEYVN